MYILFKLHCKINTHMNVNEVIKKILYSLSFIASNQKRCHSHTRIIGMVSNALYL
jgi:hypothetical protein